MTVSDLDFTTPKKGKEAREKKEITTKKGEI